MEPDDYLTEDGPVEADWNGEPHPDEKPSEA